MPIRRAVRKTKGAIDVCATIAIDHPKHRGCAGSYKCPSLRIAKDDAAMPTYICRVPSGLLSANSKAELAAAITDIHSDVSGAYPFSTQVIFRDIDADDCFIGGKRLVTTHCFIQGHIRAGRSAIERAELIGKLVPAVCGILGVPRYAVWVYLSELPSRAMSEFGNVLPEPGDEDAWWAALSAEDRRRLERA